MIFAPLFFTLFFGWVYSSDYLNDIPIAVFDRDGSQLSRSIAESFSEDQRYEVTYTPNSMEEMQQLIETKKVYMGLILPEHFEKDIKSKKGSKAALIVDGSNIAISNSAMASATEILNTLNTDITIDYLKAKGSPLSQSEKYAGLFQVDSRILWDPKLSYKYYIIPGLVLVLAQQLFLSVFVVNYIKDNENLWHKVTLHVAISAGTYYLCLVMMQRILHISLIGNLGIATALVAAYLFSLIGVAMAIGALIKDELKATQFCMMLSMPTFLMAGYVWPILKMPAFVTGLVKLLWPLVYMVSPLRDYLIKGSLPYDFGLAFSEMALFGLLWGGVGYYLNTHPLRQIPKEG